ncbi:efflux RND transporter permease subunit, partial [Pseudomonas syringae group genomosp. 7]|uniref:efflux RND transporter permease subunit n=1 Tax=Pseudomonas syringae group genomosp. 7 TaxID=251699 RepID=UPI00376FCC09
TASASSNQQIIFIALSQVARLDLVLGPIDISRENGKRVVIVSAYVRGRDLGSFVEAAGTPIDNGVQIPAGYWANWG